MEIFIHITAIASLAGFLLYIKSALKVINGGTLDKDDPNDLAGAAVIVMAVLFGVLTLIFVFSSIMLLLGIMKVVH